MLFDAHAVTLSPTEQFLLDVFIVSIAIASLFLQIIKISLGTQG